MSDEPRGASLGRAIWILAGLLVTVAAGFHIFHSLHKRSIPIPHALSGGPAYKRLRVLRPPAGLPRVESSAYRCVLRQSARPIPKA